MDFDSAERLQGFVCGTLTDSQIARLMTNYIMQDYYGDETFNTHLADGLNRMGLLQERPTVTKEGRLD